MPPDGVNDDWTQWRRHVLAEQKRQAECLQRVVDGLQAINIEIALLKLKSGIWGAVGAAIPVAILLAIQALR